ncbi:uncharacterized protein LOC143033950 [Oratosquilla oratoria]|uniref:uncharacterized protein LOC143033950 n=1 Tax=Oratosquilla oratoria TaxID=337810 RepID=UPI003F769AEF
MKHYRPSQTYHDFARAPTGLRRGTREGQMKSLPSLLLPALAVVFLLPMAHAQGCPSKFIVTHENSSSLTKFETSIEVGYEPVKSSERLSRIEFIIREVEPSNKALATTTTTTTMIARIVVSEKRQHLEKIAINDHDCDNLPSDNLRLSSQRLLQVTFIRDFLIVTLRDNVSKVEVICHERTYLTLGRKADLGLRVDVPEDSSGVFLVSVPCGGGDPHQEVQQDRLFLPFLLVASALLIALIALTIHAALLLRGRAKPRAMDRQGLLEEEPSAGLGTPERWWEVKHGGGGRREAVEADVCEEE